MATGHCIQRLRQAAGRSLTDDEVRDIFERIHRAARDIRAGRTPTPKTAGLGQPVDNVIIRAAQEAADQMKAEAALAKRQAHLQLVRMGARLRDFDTLKQSGVEPLNAAELTLVRNYRGVNVDSLEAKVEGTKAYFLSKLRPAWDALGRDFAGFFQDQNKLRLLIRELRGENTGDAMARAGAKAFHDVAEEARQVFNAAGGDIGRLDDWGMPQHHSQFKVASAGRDSWVDTILPLLDRSRYVDDAGLPWTDATLRDFLGKAWDTIATNGHANSQPGAFTGMGKRANRHAEHRQIHFKDADSVLRYWEQFGERTAVEILYGHVSTMARDIAFLEHYGPNPNTTWALLRGQALKDATIDSPKDTVALEGKAAKLDTLYEYAAGRTKPSANRNVSMVADGIASLNVAGKLGGASLASLFGDKAMMEAVSHLNNLPLLQRWRTELGLLNPAARADRRLLQRQGLMLDSIRSGLSRFYEGLGESGMPGRIANAVMRISGMNAINDIRKGAFGASMMDAIGHEISRGVDFARLSDSDIRLLRNYGITEVDWNTWKLAPLMDIGTGNRSALTPEGIARIPDDALRNAHIIAQTATAADAAKARRDAIVKLMGAINTESEFAIVTPGWKERAQFYGDLQRGTVKGEIVRSALQFKSFPWAMIQRGMDAVANAEGPVGKAAMAAYLITATTLAGAMLSQVRQMLAGKDPLKMTEEKALQFWGNALLAGGGLGIYGDFLYGITHTRYGSGAIEALSGPTLGPILELTAVQPLKALENRIEGKETHLMAQTIQDLKGFIPGNNLFYTKAALDHLVWQQVMEQLSPGYLATIRSRTLKEYGQEWWWNPGETAPDRPPDLGAAIGN